MPLDRTEGPVSCEVQKSLAHRSGRAIEFSLVYRMPSTLLSQKSSNRLRSWLGVAPFCHPKNSNSEGGTSTREKLLVSAIILCRPLAKKGHQAFILLCEGKKKKGMTYFEGVGLPSKFVDQTFVIHASWPQKAEYNWVVSCLEPENGGRMIHLAAVDVEFFWKCRTG